jgi:leader peptidase (prepilin peptidase) / N-methyltransferase
VNLAEFIMSLSLFAALCTASIIDIRTLRLPDWITLSLLLGGGLAATSIRDAHVAPAIILAIGTYLAAVLIDETYLRLRGRHGLGRGDAKLMAAAAMWLGFEGLLHMLLIACAAAFTYILLARAANQKIGAQTPIPFGPFLSLGFFASWCLLLIGGM